MIRPFVSATRVDLKDDCIPAVTEAILYSGVTPLNMETWDASYEDPVVLCECKIKYESTHFIGLFAYRYGYTPPQLDRSITEFEFDTALAYLQRPHLAIFLPNPISEFDKQLRDRSKNQKPDEKQKQELFLDKVKKNGTVQLFDNPSNLTLRVLRKMETWKQGGLRNFAAAASQKPQTSNDETRAPKKRLRLPLKAQERYFEDVLDVSIGQPACFLLHGPRGYGHMEAISRLQEIVEQKNGHHVHSVMISVDARWRSNTLMRLMEVIGLEIQPQHKPDSLDDFVIQLKRLLNTGDVLLNINNLQRLEGTLPGFLHEFWSRLLPKLEKHPYRLIVLVSFEGQIEADWHSFFNDLDTDEKISDFLPTQLIKLPELKNFTRHDILVALRRMGIEEQDAQAWSTALFDETEGGKPNLLYVKLRDEFGW